MSQFRTWPNAAVLRPVACEGVCMMSQMEEMAEAMGYKFVWSWEEL